MRQSKRLSKMRRKEENDHDHDCGDVYALDGIAAPISAPPLPPRSSEARTAVMCSSMLLMPAATYTSSGLFFGVIRGLVQGYGDETGRVPRQKIQTVCQGDGGSRL